MFNPEFTNKLNAQQSQQSSRKSSPGPGSNQRNSFGSGGQFGNAVNQFGGGQNQFGGNQFSNNGGNQFGGNNQFNAPNNQFGGTNPGSLNNQFAQGNPQFGAGRNNVVNNGQNSYNNGNPSSSSSSANNGNGNGNANTNSNSTSPGFHHLNLTEQHPNGKGIAMPTGFYDVLKRDFGFSQLYDFQESIVGNFFKGFDTMLVFILNF